MRFFSIWEILKEVQEILVWGWRRWFFGDFGSSIAFFGCFGVSGFLCVFCNFGVFGVF